MNREARRQGGGPLALLFRCPGPHGSGCPDTRTLAFVLGFGAKDGISQRALHTTCVKAGWALAVAKVQATDGSDIPAFEPVCGDCEKRLLQGMVDEAGGRVHVSAEGYIRRKLGSAVSS